MSRSKKSIREADFLLFQVSVLDALEDKIYCPLVLTFSDSSATCFERLVICLRCFLFAESGGRFTKLLFLFLLVKDREFSSVLRFHLTNTGTENRIKNKLLVNNRGDLTGLI